MGQGLHTKMTMIAAEALGVPSDQVYISETATNTVANTSSTAASASSDLNGYAIWNACSQINERLAPYREKLGPDATMKQLAHAAYFDRVNLSANGFYATPDIGYVWGANTGQMFFYFTQGVAAAEVEIDTLTGDWTCRRADIKMDVGRSINPAIDYGQIEGAFVQGMGLFTIEESLWHRASGQIFTRGPGAYKIPGFRDIPQEFNVSLLKDVNWENLRTIQRSRGVGEPPLFMGSSVFFAIRDALKAARKEWNVEDVLSLRSPATVERIRHLKRSYDENTNIETDLPLISSLSLAHLTIDHHRFLSSIDIAHMIRHDAVIEVGAVVDRIPILMRLTIAELIAILPEQVRTVPLGTESSRLP
ncbi:hypothetical protein KC350_g56 [Hortaea werneckii]|nr:hypothetical protein KC350_g56 [Hortaea werneckii]